MKLKKPYRRVRSLFVIGAFEWNLLIECDCWCDTEENVDDVDDDKNYYYSDNNHDYFNDDGDDNNYDDDDNDESIYYYHYDGDDFGDDNKI